MNKKIKVAIGVITYKRPNELKRLLNSLKNLKYDTNKYSISIILVDNDKNSSAKISYLKSRKKHSFKAYYSIEPKQGISFARNKILAISIRKGLDFVSFIDDDEIADKNWLKELLKIQEKYEADAVTGMVKRKFPKKYPLWIKNSNLFNHMEEKENGKKVDEFNTSNLLIKMDILKKENLWFDERFALTGGSDLFLSKQMIKKGYKIHWANHALTYEHIQPGRLNAKWVIMRGYRVGNNKGLCIKYLNSSFFEITRFIALSLFRITYGMIKLPFFILRKKSFTVKNIYHIARGIGSLTGLLGIKYYEYKNPS